MLRSVAAWCKATRALAALQDLFLGWDCAGAGGVINFYTRTTDYSQGEAGCSCCPIGFVSRSCLGMASATPPPSLAAYTGAERHCSRGIAVLPCWYGWKAAAQPT